MTDQELEEELAREKAMFCLYLHIAPSEYDNLTVYEKEAFIAVHLERNQQQG